MNTQLRHIRTRSIHRLLLLISLPALFSSMSGCASVSEDPGFNSEFTNIKAEQMTAWENACHRGGGVVWTKDDKDRSKRCISKEATQESLARIAVTAGVTGIYK